MVIFLIGSMLRVPTLEIIKYSFLTHLSLVFGTLVDSQEFTIYRETIASPLWLLKRKKKLYKKVEI